MNPDSQYSPGGGQQPSYQPQQPQQPQPLQQSYQPPMGGQAGVPAPQSAYAPLSQPPLPSYGRKAPNIWLILTFVFIFTTIAATATAVYGLINYFDQKNNVDSKITTAVATAVKEQQDQDAAQFLEQEKQPNRQFVGPEDYGRLAFDYPKTWSVYIANDASNGGTYSAYFNPASVPAVSSSQQYALRVSILERDYDAVVQTYQNAVSKGELKSSAVSIDGQNGTRLDGTFSRDVIGSMVLYKIRDKTVVIQTDAQVFEKDFNALIKTITFNK